MVIFSFIMINLAIILYLIPLTVYFIQFYRNKYSTSDKMLRMFFIQGMITLMILSWLLIIMNNGFNINFYLNIEFGWLLIIIIPIFIIIEIIDYFLRKKIKYYYNTFAIIARFFLPTICIVVFIMNLFIYYFSIHYFIYLLA